MKHIMALLAALALLGCATVPPPDPQAQFMARLNAMCGQAFEGRISSPPAEADTAFAGRRLVMHVRECSHGEVKIPFHVCDDRSRTWVITRTPEGLRLKHDHRHEDGSEDVLTQYGGDTRDHGTPRRQEFPADRFSQEMFIAQNIPQSVPNVWAMEVEPGSLFAYELRRPGRFFRVDFDLTRPVAAPRAPWGHE
jgi:hypothetical protein